MKVFFDAAPQGKPQYGQFYKEIYNFIQSEGYKHLDNEVIALPKQETVLAEQSGRELYVNRYNKKLKAIQDADICVFETSYPTLDLGFIIQRSIEYNKPTIVLYYKDNIPHFLSGSQDEKMMVHSYTEKNLHKILKDIFESAKEHRDKRFNFFISPKLLEYLEQISKKEGVTKSKWIRDLIVKHMRDEESAS